MMFTSFFPNKTGVSYLGGGVMGKIEFFKWNQQTWAFGRNPPPLVKHVTDLISNQVLKWGSLQISTYLVFIFRLF